MQRILPTVVVVALGATLLRGQGAKEKPKSFEIVETTIDQVHAAYKSGKLTAHRLVQGYLDRIRAYDQQGPKLNAIISLNPKALEDADRLDAQYKSSGFVGPLHGIPILVKDEIDTAGMPTTVRHERRGPRRAQCV
jgi:Asp-tRNA(Asn)/Glu-tRNA(Gln) amidotransferase A subunit family amidase